MNKFKRERIIRKREEREKQKNPIYKNQEQKINDIKSKQQAKDKEILDFKINYKNVSEDNLTISVYTSISPNHINIDNQIIAVKSWLQYDLNVYSLNTPEEITILKPIFPEQVNFIPFGKTTKHIFGKSCICINDMMHHFQYNDNDILVLINSDIILNTTKEFIEKLSKLSNICIPIAHRNDYTIDFIKNKKYNFGFDVFFINRKFINIFPPSMYSMGQTWWDYWIPYTAIKNKTPVFNISEPFAFHKEHPIQYNIKDWIKMTEYFKWENNIPDNNPQAINDSIRNEILNASISFKL